MNNLVTGLDLFLRKKGECQLMVNADLAYPGQIRLLRPLRALNSSAGSSLHSIYVGNGVVFVADGSTLKYLNSSTLTTLGTTSVNRHRYDHAGNWLFVGTGAGKHSVYIPTPTFCGWGQALPTSAPTVAAGVAGNPSGTYSCYYRYKITLPDSTVIYTALSPVASVTVSSQKIEWSGLVHASFTGATTNQIELFRTTDAWSETYLVATISSGTTTYSDNIADATLQAATTYEETGYYPPPSAPDIVKYYPAADRVFCSVDGDVYWSEAGLYHTFLYDAETSEYSNVNSVFLAPEICTAIKLIDENLYFASKRTWRRLRGRTPTDWEFEDTSAETGPINNESAVETIHGIIYPVPGEEAKDAQIRLFAGLTDRQICPEFVFSANPTSACHALWDGRFYRLFYADSTYPELAIDFLGFPNQSPRIVKSTRTATGSFYDRENRKLYLSDVSYLRQGRDTSQDVALSFRTCDIPPEDLSVLGNMGKLLVKMNSLGNSLTITPRRDGVAGTALTAISNSATGWKEVPIDFGDCRELAFDVAITANDEIVIYEPWMLIKE